MINYRFSYGIELNAGKPRAIKILTSIYVPITDVEHHNVNYGKFFV